jgi:hypothetical protein
MVSIASVMIPSLLLASVKHIQLSAGVGALRMRVASRPLDAVSKGFLGADGRSCIVTTLLVQP